MKSEAGVECDRDVGKQRQVTCWWLTADKTLLHKKQAEFLWSAIY